MKKLKPIILAAAVILLAAILASCNPSSTKKELADYVDPLLGTSSSRWMLFPGPCLPFGWMVHQILAQLNLRDFFDIVVTKEHVSKHKPDPEAYLLALEKLSVSGSAVLVFEDSNSGLIAAQKAKCDSVAFLHDFNLNHDFSIAVQVISDFSEFLAKAWNVTILDY